MKAKNWDIVLKFAEDVASGKKRANKYQCLSAKRFLNDLKNPEYEINKKDAEFCIQIIENTLCHQQGESLEGEPLRGTPFLLQPWQKFIIYNVVGFRLKGTDILRFHECLIYVPRKNGKALSLNEDIPTPDGWKKMKDIHTGDLIFSVSGKATKVVNESEIFFKPLYRVTFEDGSTIDASEDHIWTVQTKDSRRTSKRKTKRTPKKPELRDNDGWYEISTKEILKDYKKLRHDEKGIEYKYRVPLAEAVSYSEKELKINPYVLGVWLGDGTSSNQEITVSDFDSEEMLFNIQKCGYRCFLKKEKERANKIVIDPHKRGCSRKLYKNSFREYLKEYNLLNNKHIPEIYMLSSIEQRQALLQGLMDTDGFVSKSGQCEFTQKNKKISYQVLELVRSLGYKASISKKEAMCNGKNAGIVYVIRFYADKTKICFRLRRKAERVKESLSARMKAKSIIDIRRIEDIPSKCLEVEDSSHLYLAGKGFTATHNSSFAAALAWALSLLFRRSGSKVYIASGALMQSLESFNFLKYNIQRMEEDKKHGGLIDIKDSYVEHSMSADFGNGSFFIRALAANPDTQDSLNMNIAILDRLLSHMLVTT